MKNETIKRMVALACKTMVKVANGSASMNFIYQPKKPSSCKNTKEK